MWAAIGFTVTGIFFGFFAYTFNSLVIQKTKLKLKQFSYAYYFLALAFVIWGLAAANGSEGVLQKSVIAGNVLILLGTLFMLDIWLGVKRRAWLWLAAIVSVLLIYIRVKQYSPVPYLKDGVLVFNSQRPVIGILATVFLFIWLPLNMKVADKVTNAVKQPNIRQIYSGIYILATFSALIFLTTKRVITVVLSFIALSICFALLIASNMLVKKLKEDNGSKQSR